MGRLRSAAVGNVLRGKILGGLMDPLLKIALIGTAKAPPSDLTFADHPTDGLLIEFSATDPEHRLLLQAGIRAVSSRCGHLPQAGIELLPPAPFEDGPPCSLRLNVVLQNALLAKDYPLLREFLPEMHRVSLRISP